MSWRFARASDIDRYYGARPKTTLNAVVILLDDEPAGIIGVSREDGLGKYFSEYRPELQEHLGRLPVLRAIKASMQLVRNYPLPVVAATEIESGHRTLQKLGFTQLDDETYQWISQQQG